ncbi:MAG: FeoB small GTPase domain-containing protein [Streptococcus sp.]|uniref:FeoB small GTPase domain-containing protein n=1 Tax=Streptococcus sp. TaxID=1306 RepID=UPI003991E747
MFGNWPGVTVEKKTGKLKRVRQEREVNIRDLPGIYSLSPYTLEEVVSRDFILNEKPDVIIDLVDATNIERNLYLTTQLLETGIQWCLPSAMADLMGKNDIRIDVEALSRSWAARLLRRPLSGRRALRRSGGRGGRRGKEGAGT